MCGPVRNRGAVDANERSEDNFCSTKITQELREFAAKQNAGVDSFLATTPVRPELVEGSLLSSSEDAEKKDGASTSSARTEEDAEAGMAVMTEKFREDGSELYLGAGGREHD